MELIAPIARVLTLAARNPIAFLVMVAAVVLIGFALHLVAKRKDARSGAEKPPASDAGDGPAPPLE